MKQTSFRFPVLQEWGFTLLADRQHHRIRNTLHYEALWYLWKTLPTLVKTAFSFVSNISKLHRDVGGVRKVQMSIRVNWLPWTWFDTSCSLLCMSSANAMSQDFHCSHRIQRDKAWGEKFYWERGSFLYFHASVLLWT